LGAIFRLYEARRNGIRSQPLFATKSSALSPATIEEPRICSGKSGGILPPRRRFGSESRPDVSPDYAGGIDKGAFALALEPCKIIG
jgi:hypothetical protein